MIRPDIAALALAALVVAAAARFLFRRRRRRRSSGFGALPASWLQERAHLEERVEYEGPSVKWPMDKQRNEATLKVIKKQGRKRA